MQFLKLVFKPVSKIYPISIFMIRIPIHNQYSLSTPTFQSHQKSQATFENLKHFIYPSSQDGAELFQLECKTCLNSQDINI